MAEPQNDAKLLYPVDHISTVAAQLLVNASTAQQLHDSAWSELQTYLQNAFAPELQETVMKLIKPYVEHLSSSYNWQLDLASALFDATEVITGTDDKVANQFNPGKHHGFQ